MKSSWRLDSSNDIGTRQPPFGTRLRVLRRRHAPSKPSSWGERLPAIQEARVRNAAEDRLRTVPSLRAPLTSLLLWYVRPLLSFDSVEPSIAGLDVQASTGEHRVAWMGAPRESFTGVPRVRSSA